MKLHLSNLDELVQKVRNTHAKNYMIESIAAYRTGAYRASLITTWIAVCVDIIEKIKELSLSEDPAAKKIAARLEKIQPDDPKSMLEFERDILSIACDEMQFISSIEKSHLERLKNDRNVCAHPTFSDDGSQFTPPAELVLAYIVQGANYLLIHQPVKGKVILDRLFELINEPSFPENEEKAFLLLSSENNLGRVKESVVRNLLIILLKRVFRDDTGLSPDLLNRISASLNAIYRIYPGAYEEVVSSKLGVMLSEANDPILKRIFPFLRLRNELWQKIDRPERVRIEGLIDSMSSDEISKYQVTKLAEVNLDIRSMVLTKISQLDSNIQSKIIAAYPCIFLKDKSIELFSSALSFDSAEYRGNKLLIPMSGHFTDDDLQKVFNGALENTGSYGINQILNAGAIGLFFCGLYDETKSAPLNHKALWLDFWERISARDYSYTALKDKLIEDNYLASEQQMEEEDIPF